MSSDCCLISLPRRVTSCRSAIDLAVPLASFPAPATFHASHPTVVGVFLRPVTSTSTEPLVSPVAFILPAPWRRSLVTLSWISSLGFEKLCCLHSPLTSLSLHSHVLGWVFDFFVSKGWCVPGRASVSPDLPVSLPACFASPAGMLGRGLVTLLPSPSLHCSECVTGHAAGCTHPGIFAPSVFGSPSPLHPQAYAIALRP